MAVVVYDMGPVKLYSRPMFSIIYFYKLVGVIKVFIYNILPKKKGNKKSVFQKYRLKPLVYR